MVEAKVLNTFKFRFESELQYHLEDELDRVLGLPAKHDVP